MPIVEAKADKRRDCLGRHTHTLSLQIDGKFENESLRIFCFGTAICKDDPEERRQI